MPRWRRPLPADDERKIDPNSSAGQAIDIEISDGKSFGDPLRPAASKQGVHAGHQFEHRKRLDDIVVRADREATHALRFCAPGGDHDDRQGARGFVRPQTPANFDARYARQHPVEN